MTQFFTFLWKWDELDDCQNRPNVGTNWWKRSALVKGWVHTVRHHLTDLPVGKFVHFLAPHLTSGENLKHVFHFYRLNDVCLKIVVFKEASKIVG